MGAHHSNIAISSAGLLKSATYLIWIGVLSLLCRCTVSANTCTTYNKRQQQMERFDCPKRGDDWDERYCCGPSMKQKCCDYEDFLEENPDLSGGVVAVIVILTMLFFGCLILAFCCCCSCCYLAQRRQRRGLVLATGTPPTTVITSSTPANQPGAGGVYPRQTYYQPVANYPPSTQPPNFAAPNTGSYPYQNPPDTHNIYPPVPPLEYEKPPPYFEN